jgi:SAM-dependent methyltransferase
MTHIEVPTEFHRNSANVLALGVEHTGSILLNTGNALLGLPDLSGRDVLDVGCGVRFTQTIINRDLPVGSYTGIDVYEPMTTYLSDHVRDSRFSFHAWNVYNERYNTAGEKLTKRTRLPVPHGKKFDVIWMYSVITHNDPHDTECLLRILRRHVKRGGGLLFSAFVDNAIDDFEDRVKDQPLLNAYYNEAYLRRIASKAGWRVERRYDEWEDVVMQNLFVCRPKWHFGGIL